MSRIRTIKPEFWTSEQIVECSPNARLMFIGLWNFCDDGGVHPAQLKKLKMQIFPGDDFTTADMAGMVAELISNKLMIEYEVDGASYWYVTGWHHQKIDRPSKKYPGPPVEIVEDSPNSRRIVDERSATPRDGREGKVREGKVREGSESAREKKNDDDEFLVLDDGNPSDENFPAREKNWMEVAAEMAEYFSETDEGRAEWAYMESAAMGRADPMAVCAEWAGKQQGRTHLLKNWRSNTGKLTPWIRTQALTDRQTEAKIKKINPNGHIISQNNLAEAARIALSGD